MHPGDRPRSTARALYTAHGTAFTGARTSATTEGPIVAALPRRPAIDRAARTG